MPYHGRLLVFLLLCLTMLMPSLTQAAQAPCTHWASPGGGGTGLAPTSPFHVADFWPMARPGSTLCLLDGTYAGTSNMITMPASVRGSASQPLTIRALHDGQVVLAGGTTRPIHVAGQYISVEGIDATGGNNASCVLGGSHNSFRRILCADGSASADSGLRFAGPHNLMEDVVFIGTARKPINCGPDVLGPGHNTVRRAFALFTGKGATVGSQPTNAFELGYGQDACTFENIVGTWDTAPGGVTGDPEGVFETFRSHDSFVGGAIFYIPQPARFPSSRLVFALTDAASNYQKGHFHPMRNFLLTNSIALIHPHHPRFAEVVPFTGVPASGGLAGSNNRIEHSLGVGGKPNVIGGAGWSQTQVRYGTSMADALRGSGHTSPWTLIPGVCRRYVNRTLTQTPLWPWPMEQRIDAALQRSGKAPVRLTTTLEHLLGPIPAQCRGTGTDEAPGTATLPAPRNLRVLSAQ